MNGRMIDSLKNLSQEIYPLIFGNQFQDPNIKNDNSLFELNKDIENNRNENHAVNTSHIDIYTSSPSDFRFDPVICDKTMNDDSNKECEETSTVYSKPIRKLFYKFIGRLNKSIEW